MFQVQVQVSSGGRWVKIDDYSSYSEAAKIAQNDANYGGKKHRVVELVVRSIHTKKGKS